MPPASRSLNWIFLIELLPLWSTCLKGKMYFRQPAVGQQIECGSVQKKPMKRKQADIAMQKALKFQKKQ